MAAETPVVETPPVVEPVIETPSGLPSDNTKVDYSGFELSDDIKTGMKDGKINGRFGSVDEILAKLKETEDKFANDVRINKDEQTKREQIQQTETTQQNVILEMIPDFQANGMQLTPEMEVKAKEAGIDIRDLKIGAMEMKQNVDNAHSVVGGADEYNNMMAWAKENISDEQKAIFDKDITGGMSSYAIKGLYGDYKAAVGADGYQPRIEGNGTVRGIVGYADRRELYKDKDYVDSAAGRRDPQAIINYKARLAATNKVVLGI